MTPSALLGSTDAVMYPAPLRAASGASDVVIVRWPEEAATLDRLRTLGQPRLLLVAPNAAAPATDDCDEDWIRLPAEDADMRGTLSAARLKNSCLEGFGVFLPRDDRNAGQSRSCPEHPGEASSGVP